MWLNHESQNYAYTPFLLLIFVGPLNDGQFLPVTVQSVHRNKAPCRVVRASQSASLGLNQAVPGLRSGMVLLSPESKPAGCLFFQVSTSPSSFHFLD